MDISDRGNAGAIVPYSEDKDISKFILVPSQNDPLTKVVNFKIASIRMQLKMQDDRLTARGAEDDEKMAKVLQIVQETYAYACQTLAKYCPSSSQRHCLPTASIFLFFIHIFFQSPYRISKPSPYHLTQDLSPHKPKPSFDLNQTPQHLSDGLTPSDPKSPTSQVQTSPIIPTETSSSIPTTVSSILVPATIQPSSTAQPLIPAILPPPSSLPKPLSHRKSTKTKRTKTKAKNPNHKPKILSNMPFKLKNHPKGLQWLLTPPPQKKKRKIMKWMELLVPERR